MQVFCRSTVSQAYPEISRCKNNGGVAVFSRAAEDRDGIGHARKMPLLTELGNLFCFRFYKDAAPTALKQIVVRRTRRRRRKTFCFLRKLRVLRATHQCAIKFAPATLKLCHCATIGTVLDFRP